MRISRNNKKLSDIYWTFEYNVLIIELLNIQSTSILNIQTRLFLNYFQTFRRNIE